MYRRLPTLDSFASFGGFDATTTDAVNQLITDLTPAAQAAIQGAHLTNAQKAALAGVLPTRSSQASLSSLPWLYIGLGVAGVAAAYFLFLRKR